MLDGLIRSVGQMLASLLVLSSLMYLQHTPVIGLLQEYIGPHCWLCYRNILALIAGCATGIYWPSLLVVLQEYIGPHC